jgi:DNA replicative helicase MCM subunit Mcm2 (Cdc46/Mcm family)
MDENELRTEIGNFIHDYYNLDKPFMNSCWDKKEEIQSAVFRDAKRIIIDYNALKDFDSKNDTNLSGELVKRKYAEIEDLINIFEEEINSIDRVRRPELSGEVNKISTKPEHIKINEENKLKVGFKNLDETIKISEMLEEKNQGKLIQIEGFIQNIGIPFRFSKTKAFICSVCSFEVRKNFEITDKKYSNKYVCPSCNRERPFIEDKEREVSLKVQTLTLAEEVSGSSMPMTLLIILFNDLIDNPEMEKRKFIAGKKIKVVGLLKEMKTKSPRKKIYLEGMNWNIESDDIILEEEDVEKIKKFSRKKKLVSKLVEGYCPSVYGYDDVKEALILQAVGGVTKISPIDKKLKRGNIHILLIGDPALGKSTLGLFTYNHIPKSKYAVCSSLSLEYNEPLIFSENGKIKITKIGEFVENYNEESSVLIPSINPKTFKIEWKPLKGVFKHPDNRHLLKIYLETGRQVTITQDHSIYVADENGIHTKRGDELENGDFVVIPNKIPAINKHPEKIDLVEELLKLPEEKTKNIYLHNVPREALKKIGKTYKNDHLEREMLPLKEARKLPEKILKNAKISTKGIPTSIPIDERLMTLLGYYIAEGYFSSKDKFYYKTSFCFGDKDKRLRKKTKKIVKELFNLECREEGNPKYPQLSINDKIVLYLFRDILKVKKYASKKEIPEIVFNVKPNLQLAFLRAYTEGDYGVSASKKLISDIQYLSLLMGKVVSSHEVIGSISEIKGREIKPQKKHYYLSRVSTKNLIDGKIRGLDKIKKIPDKLLPFIFGKTFGYGKRNMRTNSKSLAKRGKENRYKFKNKNLEFYKKIEESDIGFVKIKKIEKAFHKNKLVYDISVEGNENFIGGFGGILCHNTSAGLGVAMLKDSETESWYVSAGVLPLCHKSIAVLDELDKANPEDIKSLDIVMSIQQLPVDKAGISMKLPAQTTVLAIANPKLSRFEPYKDLKEQVALTEVTLSRFDLKFAFRDVVNEDRDEEIADRIFDREKVKTGISPEFLTKYLIYARKIEPEFTRRSANVLKKFYRELRRKTSETGGILQITPRQLEGLIRLTEAYAKLKLRDKTNERDAEKAIEIFKSYLRTFGFEPDTGNIDIDKAEGRTSGKVRKGIDIVETVFKSLHNIFGQNIPKEEVIKVLKDDYGIEKANEWYNKVLREGFIVEPRPNYVKWVEI